MREFITADSLGFLSAQGLYAFTRRGEHNGFCDACFSGNYPVPVQDETRKRQLVLFEVGDR
jgi:amidophosphoribosyltransferase